MNHVPNWSHQFLVFTLDVNNSCLQLLGRHGFGSFAYFHSIVLWNIILKEQRCVTFVHAAVPPRGEKYSNISVSRRESHSSALIQTPMLILTKDLLSPRLTFIPIVNVGVYNFLLSNGKKSICI